MTSPFDFTGPSHLAKALKAGEANSHNATKRVERQRAAGISDATALYGLSTKAVDRRVPFSRQKRK